MPAYTYPNLSFSSERQSIYGDGQGLTLSDEFKATVDWDFDISPSIGPDPITIIPAGKIWTPFGYIRTDAVVLDFQTEIGFDLASEGSLGIAAGYNIDTGSISTQFVYDATAEFVDALRAPLGVATQFVEGGAEVASGAFQSFPVDLSAYVDFVYALDLSFGVGGQVTGNSFTLIPEVSFSAPFGDLRTDDEGDGRFGILNATLGKLQLIENVFSDLTGLNLGEWFIELAALSSTITFEINPYTNEIEVSWGTITLSEDGDGGGGADDEGLPELTFDIAELKFAFPQPAPEAKALTADGTLVGQDADAFLTSTVDLDGAINTALVKAFGLFVPVDQKFEFGALDLQATVLDADAGPELRLYQEFEVTPDDLVATVAFTDLDGAPVEVDLGDGTAATSWTGLWSEFPTLAIDAPVIATPSFSTGATLLNDTGIEFGALATANFLAASYKVEFLGEGASGKFGPLLSYELTEDELERELGLQDLVLPIYDGPPVDLGGFGTVAGAPIVLDVEGTDDPGRSGVDDGINDQAPVGVDDSLSAGEDERVVFSALDFLANDYDFDAYDTLSVTAVGAPSAGGAARVRPDGSIVFGPSGDFEALAAGETATTEIVYTVSDAVGRTDTATAVITVEGANDAPEARNDVYQTRTETFGTFINIEGELWGSVLENDSDPDDGDAPGLAGDGFAQIITTTLGAEVELFLASGEFEYDASNIQAELAGLGNGQALIDSFDYTVVDGSGATDTATVSFIILGEVPEGEEPVREVRIATGDLALEEGETGEVIVYSTAPIAPGSEGGVTVGFSTDDGTIAVDPPSREFDATNPIADPTISAETPAIVEVTPGDGETPRSATFTAEITASTYGTSDPDLAVGETDTVTITVAEAPAILTSASEVEVTEGGAAGSVGVRLSREPSGTVTVLLAASDPLVTLSAASLTFDASNWEVEQAVTVTPPGDDTVDALQVLDLTLSIDQGATGDDFDGAEDLIVDVVVAPDNLPPVAVFDEATTDEEAPVVIDVLDNDTDPDGDALSVAGAEVGTPLLAANGAVAVNDDGTLTYTPDPDFSGTDVITYTVSDGEDEATGSVVVTVNPVNDAPEAGGTIVVTAEETAVGVDLSDLVSDVDGDALTYTVTGTQNGTVENLGDGVFRFTPDVDFVNTTLSLDDEGDVETDADGNALYVMIDGAETAFFEYEVSDGQQTATGTALVMVTPVNDAPEAGGDGVATDEDTAITVDPADLLADDSDPEGGAVSFVDVEYRSATGFVWFDEETGLIEYDPNGQFEALAEGQTTTDTFSYVVEDELGAEGVGEVTVTINGVNDAPVAVEDGFSLTLDATGGQDATSFGNLLSNDTDLDDGDTLAASLGPNSLDGLSNLGASVSVAPDGTFTYDASTAFDVPSGEAVFDFFDYTATDGSGATSEATVTMLVLGEGAGPGLALSRTDLTVEEPGTGDVFHVALTQAPTADVTVTITSSDETEAVPLLTQITFTPDDWDEPRFVEVSAVDDRAEDGDQSTNITVAVSDTADADYAGLSETIAVTALDEPPSARIDVDAQSVTLTEGEAGVGVGVTLGQQPTANVVVAVDTGGDDVGASPSTLTFTPANWDVAQTVTLTAVDDDEEDGPALQFVTLAVDEAASATEYADATPEIVVAVALDDDGDDDGDGDGGTGDEPPTVSIGAGPTLAEGDAGTTAFAFTLTRTGDTAAASTVDWAVTGSGADPADAADFDGGVLPSGSVTFAAGEAEATIEVAVAGDTAVEPDEGFTVTLTADTNAAIGTATATATIVGDDAATVVAVTGDTAPEVQENATAVGAYAVTGDGVAGVRLAGADGDLFGFDEATGTLAFLAPPDFESPADDGADNGYDVTIEAVDDADATLASLAVAVAVTDVDEGGGGDAQFLVNGEGYDVESFGASQDEGTAEVSGDGAALTVEDNGWKVVRRDTVVTEDTLLRFDFEASEAAEIYAVAFETDANASAGTSFRLSGSQGWGIADFATYAVGSGTVSYEIPVGDYFTGSFDRIAFVADDDAGGGGSATWSNVTLEEAGDGGNAAPIVTGDATPEVAENTTAVGIYAVADDEGDPVAVTLEGDDGDLFAFDASTGALAFVDAPDFEAPASADDDNLYEVVIRAADATGAGTLAVTIEVTDVVEDGGGDGGREVLVPDQPRTVFTVAPGDLLTIEGFDVNEGAENTFDALVFSGDGLAADDVAGLEALAATLAGDGADRTRLEVDGDDLLIVTGTAEVLLTDVVGRSGLTEAGLLAAGAVEAGSEPVLTPDQLRTVFEVGSGDLLAVEGFDVDGGGENSFDTLVLVADGLSAATAAEFEAMAAALAADGVDRTRLEVRGDDLRVFGSDAEILLADVVGRDGLTAQGLEDAGATLV